MSNDITKEILLNAGFQKDGCGIFSIKGSKPIVIYYKSSPVNGRHWKCFIYSDEMATNLLVDAYIQTVEYFNKLMELEDINFKLVEE